MSHAEGGIHTHKSHGSFFTQPTNLIKGRRKNNLVEQLASVIFFSGFHQQFA